MQLTEQQKKEGWRIVKFGEIAKSVSKRVDPADTELEVYVGLEHLDPDNLRITRRGVPSDVKGQKLLVRPGQIIFGKRRAYQRKVAVADFEGICSAHAMVLEAIPKEVVPEYLPFFMQSDMFMERAVAISEGSLSPTIKWKTLANQEFPLPPRPRQEEMLEVLTSMEECLKRNTCLIDSIRRIDSVFSRKALKITYKKRELDEGWRVLELSDLFENLDRKRVPIKSADRKKMSGDVPYYGASGVIDYVDRHIFDEDILLVSEDGANLEDRNTPIAFKVSGKSFVNNHAHVYKPINANEDIDWVVKYFEYLNIQPYLTGTAQPKLNKKKSDAILISYPSEAQKKNAVNFFKSTNAMLEKSENKSKQIILMRNKYISLILEGAA